MSDYTINKRNELEINNPRLAISKSWSMHASIVVVWENLIINLDRLQDCDWWTITDSINNIVSLLAISCPAKKRLNNQS